MREVSPLTRQDTAAAEKALVEGKPIWDNHTRISGCARSKAFNVRCPSLAIHRLKGLLAAKTTREIRVGLAREDTQNLGIIESAILRDLRARSRWQHPRL